MEPLWKEVMTKTMHVESKMRLHSFTYHVSVGVRGACIHVCVCVCVCEGSYRETGIPDAEHSAVRGPLQPIQVAGLCLKVLQTNTDALKPNCTGSMHSP